VWVIFDTISNPISDIALNRDLTLSNALKVPMIPEAVLNTGIDTEFNVLTNARPGINPIDEKTDPKTEKVDDVT
jgi:hypothetical protein